MKHLERAEGGEWLVYRITNLEETESGEYLM